ncbi:MAG: RNA chaperone Hfq [Selenomonadaceae bacterium]|nr:RNA chaperone Hfq [Selenomonadaceae bacterium]MBR1858078.1 RNA chaperone Hfq [Selenomonadaceae bacterium]
MVSKTNKFQDFFLDRVRKENIVVVVHLINGFQIKGTVKGFDMFTVVVDSMGKQQLIFKHAISTITPTKEISATADDVDAAAAVKAVLEDDDDDL